MRRSPLLLLPLICLVACSRCGKAGGERTGIDGLLRRLPQRAQAVVILPDLAILGEKIAGLQKLKIASFAAQLQGFGSAEEYVNALMTQLGVDLRASDELRKIGIRPEGGAAVVWLGAEDAYSVIAIGDHRRFEGAMAALAGARLGAQVIQRSKVAGRSRLTFARREGAAPELVVIFDDAYAWVSGPASVEMLTRAAALTESDSLAKDSTLAAGLNRLPKERDVLAYFSSAALADHPSIPLGAVVTARLSPEGLVVHSDLPWQDGHGTLEKMTPQPARSLLGILPDDAFLVARFTGDATVLDAYWPQLFGAALQRAVRQAKLNVKEDVLGALNPGGVASLSLASTLKLAAGMPALDIRRTNPFHYVHLTAAANVKDPGRAQQVLDQVPGLAAQVGATVTPAVRGGQKVMLTSYSQGEGAHLALKGDTLVVAAPERRLLEAVARVGAPGAGPITDPALLSMLDHNAFGMVIDLRRLAASVKALPSDAWGVGGFAIKATTVRWLEATDDLRAILFSATARDGALQAELTLRLSPP